MPPMRAIWPASSSSRSTGLRAWICSLTRSTLSSATRSTNAAFAEHRSVVVLVSRCTASSIFWTRPLRWPSRAASQAPLTAPQRVWPRTTTALAPASLHANSIDPRMSSLSTFPAMRQLKMSPSPWSKINSALVRESMQLRMMAMGCCPSLVSFACWSRLRLALRLFWNRSLPRRRTSITSRGLSASRISRVSVRIGCSWYESVRTAR